MVYVKNNWWKIAIIVLFLSSLLFLANFHEHWSDEAQSFLLARDNNFLELMHWIRYEGTPPLWVIIIKIFIKLGGTYDTFYLLPIFFSCIGISIFELKIKLPWYIKLLFPFTYFIFYQYSIVARSYCLVFPVLMILISLHDKKIKMPIIYSLILFIFMNISLHTLVISGSLYVLFLIDIYKDNKFKNKSNVVACCLIFIELLITAICTYPSPDCCFLGNGGKNLFHVISETTVGSNTKYILEIIITILVCGIVFLCNKENKKYSIIRGLILFTPLLMIYIFITYQIWHVGIIFFLMLSYFIVNDTINTQKVVKIMFIFIFIVQIYWSICSFYYDYNNKYSASKDVAEFIVQNKFDNKLIYGIGYSVTGIQPYFEKNIFVNQNTDKAFYSWKVENGYDENINNDVGIYIISKFYQNNYYDLVESLQDNNYQRIDFQAYTFSKNYIYESEGYSIYIKNEILTED